MFEYQQCYYRLLAIQNGTLSVGGVNNETLSDSGWIWRGDIAGLNDYPRQMITAITYKGCRELCGDYTELNTASTAMSMVATWIFPLAILFNLPYDSLHFKKWRRTTTAVCNWLGSPQTAMTATIFNFDQIRKCHRQAKGEGRTWEDAYYVLSCFNQFQLPTEVTQDGTRLNERFIRSLIYGLFRPLRVGERTREPGNQDIEHTRQLLSALASQLRMLRRRGVLPTLLGLGSFLLAFIFSVVLAFAEVGQNVNVTPLTIGLLYNWLPLLVICTIIDRNPVSSERTAELMSRWLYNVDAVQAWKLSQHQGSPPDSAWWRGTRKIPSCYYVHDFIGQGRRMEYCGLVHATLGAIPKPQDIEDEGGLDEYDACANIVSGRLQRHRPGLWWSSAIRAFILVWIQILMAIIVAITSPTVGIGCWSGSFLVFGGLTSISWAVSLCTKSYSRWLRVLCDCANITAVIFIIFITALVLTGAMNNCYCNTTWMAYPYSGGYMIFEDNDFIRRHFNVVVPWAMASSIAFSVSATVFATAVLWWVKCQHLWTTNERSGAIIMHPDVQADLHWLQ